jgi:uncharacterized protein
MPTLRLIESDDGWWCTLPGKAAHLPQEAVAAGSLVPEARAALDAQGFFASSSPVFGLTVLTATSCNLGCAYCFQNVNETTKNPFAPARIARRLLTQEDVVRVASFVQQRMHTLGIQRLSLLLFGGEPLLNPQACLGLLGALQLRGLADAEMISNVVLLRPSLARKLEDAGLRRIQVTFDGARTEHDGTRVDHTGSGTYDKILTNVADAASCTELAWHFRVNASHHNLDGIEDLIDDLASLPLGQPPTLHLALIDDVGVGYDNHLRYAAELTDRFTSLIDRAFDHGLHVRVMGAPVSDCPYCGQFAGGSGAVVNADGTLASCWETAGRPEWTVGDIHNGYLPDSDITDKWVACRHEAQGHGTPEDSRGFYDSLDAFILDRTYRPQRQHAIP